MPIHIPDPLQVEARDWDIHKYHKEDHIFVLRPPYQRKNVWNKTQKRELMDSFVRQLYVPPVVLRQVIIDDKDLRYEVVDGQQRILTIQEFFNDQIQLPDSDELRNIHEDYDLAGRTYSEFDRPVKDYFKSRCTLRAVVMVGISDPNNHKDQELAANVFWRLQQGEDLTTIEENHSKIYSPARNVLVSLADDLSFDPDSYESRDHNPDRHDFFPLLSRKNNRLQHLALVARFLLIEIADGPTRVTRKELTKLFDCEHEGFTIRESEEDYRERSAVRRLKSMLDTLVAIYVGDPFQDDDGKIKFLSKEYFIISLYTLIRELEFGDYNFSAKHYDAVREFTHHWYKRLTQENDDDQQILRFKEARQQNREAVNKRHYIIEDEFWKTDPQVVETDSQRLFSRADRIQLFVEGDRVCPHCVDEGQSEEEARVSWSDWDADHVEPFAEGGNTELENARILCTRHNRARG